MGRMEKYEEPNETSLSRTNKNKDLYKDVYLNNSVVDFANIMDDDSEYEEEKEIENIIIETTSYVEKEYDINKYLEERRMMIIKDNLPRSLNDEIKKSDDEISEIVSRIEQKEKEADLFNDLLPDDEDTTVIEGNGDLNSFVSDEVINNYVMNKDLDETNSFMDLDDTKIIEEKKQKTITKRKKILGNKKLSIIIFAIISFLLLGIVVYLVIKIF